MRATFSFFIDEALASFGAQCSRLNSVLPERSVWFPLFLKLARHLYFQSYLIVTNQRHIKRTLFHYKELKNRRQRPPGRLELSALNVLL